jgi:hypothetical protein
MYIYQDHDSMKEPEPAESTDKDRWHSAMLDLVESTGWNNRHTSELVNVKSPSPP